jgi:hypothetical protein
MIEKPELVKVFRKEGVTVIVPPQKVAVVVSQRPLISPDIVKQIPLPKGFFLIRPVINFDLHRPRSSTPITTFDPPIELHVHFTQADMIAAREHKEGLRLGYYYEIEKGQWKWFFFDEKKHRIDVKPDPNPENGGEWVVHISKWGDPMIAWGA